MSATGEGRSRARGFTLIEMLVTIAVMGLVSGLAFPAVERIAERQMFRTTVARTLLELRSARAEAIRTDRMVRFDARKAQPAGTPVAIETPSLVFFPDGSATGGSVALKAPRASAVITVDPVSGIAMIRA